MDLVVNLTSGGERPPGADYQTLTEDVRAELQEFANKAEARLEEKSTGAPEGAQGDEQLLHFLVHVAENPAMIRLYISGLTYGLNALIRKFRGEDAAKPAQPEAADGQKSLELSKGTTLDLKVLGKEIVLPATAAVISEFVKTVSTPDA